MSVFFHDVATSRSIKKKILCFSNGACCGTKVAKNRVETGGVKIN